VQITAALVQNLLYCRDVGSARSCRRSHSHQLITRRLALWENSFVAAIDIVFAHLRLCDARNAIEFAPFT